jgi:amino acid permease
VAFAIFWLAFLILYPITYGTLNGYQDYILNAYLWLLIGILFRLPALAGDPVQALRPMNGLADAP